MSSPLVLVHGGAGLYADDRIEPAREGCRRAAEAGAAVLARGGSALDQRDSLTFLDPLPDAGVLVPGTLTGLGFTAPVSFEGFEMVRVGTTPYALTPGSSYDVLGGVAA